MKTLNRFYAPSMLTVLGLLLLSACGGGGGSGSSGGGGDPTPTATGTFVKTITFLSSTGLGGVMTSTNASISADGRFVAFASLVETLVEGDDNLLQDVFVRDRVSGTTVRVNVASDGAQANGTSDLPDINADAR